MDKTDEDLPIEDQRSLLLASREGTTSRFFADGADLAEATVRTYRASWNDFLSWCRGEDHQALPASPETISAYLYVRDHLALSTLRNRLSTLSFVHRYFDLGDPTSEGAAAEARRKIAREKRREESSDLDSPTSSGQHPPSKVVKGGLDLLSDYLNDLAEEEVEEESGSRLRKWKENREGVWDMWRDPLIPEVRASTSRMTEKQKELIPSVGPDLSRMRDRAILLLMSATGTSRAEAARIDFIDLVPHDDHLLVGIRKKNGRPDRRICIFEEEPLHLCPLRAVVAWAVGTGLEGGPLLRAFDSHRNLKEARIGTSSINLILEKAAEAAGLPPGDWTPRNLQNEPETE